MCNRYCNTESLSSVNEVNRMSIYILVKSCSYYLVKLNGTPFLTFPNIILFVIFYSIIFLVTCYIINLYSSFVAWIKVKQGCKFHS